MSTAASPAGMCQQGQVPPVSGCRHLVMETSSSSAFSRRSWINHRGSCGDALSSCFAFLAAGKPFRRISRILSAMVRPRRSPRGFGAPLKLSVTS
eukprot:1204195-Rhodomonas_salina.1